MWQFMCLFIIFLKGVNCIVTKSELPTASDKNDNAVAESVNRDYSYDEAYGHGIHGLSEYAYHEGYGVIESNKHHIHHAEDHHHHHLHHAEDHHHHHHPHHEEDHHHHHLHHAEDHHHHLHHAEDHHHHHHNHHKHSEYDHHKALAIKSLLVPLAGVALLGAAAAFVSNPILLQLGVISSTALGRKKRDTALEVSRKEQIRLNEIKLLERFMAQIPKQDIETQEKKLVANYFSCSGITTKNFCLERLTCELHSKKGKTMAMEYSVLKIVVNEILNNDFVADETKIRLSKAIERGTRNLSCNVYECEKLEKSIEKQLKSPI